MLPLILPLVFPLAFLLFLTPGTAATQENPNIQALEAEYLSAQGEYQAAFHAMEALESRFDQALEEWDAANASGDEDRVNRAFTETQRLAAESQSQELRVEEKAEDLREARSNLLTALSDGLDDLMSQVASASDSEEQAQLTAILRDRNIRYLDLRAEEDPETTLEPMREYNISPSDSPRDILRMAETLDFRADQYVARLAAIEVRLEGLRADQQRNRSVRDMVAGLERFGDIRLPVVSPGSRTVPPPDPSDVPPGTDTVGVEAGPMTLEERIASLELLQGEMDRRLREIRDKAARYRRLAGGGGGV